jgi:hypothetical protein
MASSVVLDKQKQKFKSLKSKNYPIVKINKVLPFRVRFTNIGIPGYSSNNPAPIGIAIIGLNNYIL